MNHNPTHCHLCSHEAVAIFFFSHGCVCDKSTIQPLCEHHARKAQPLEPGTMELIKDLTVGEEFSKQWK